MQLSSRIPSRQRRGKVHSRRNRHNNRLGAGNRLVQVAEPVHRDSRLPRVLATLTEKLAALGRRPMAAIQTAEGGPVNPATVWEAPARSWTRIRSRRLKSRRPARP